MSTTAKHVATPAAPATRQGDGPHPRNRSRRPAALSALILLSIVAAGCQAGAASTSTSSPSETATTSSPAPSVAMLGGCPSGPCPLDPGTYRFGGDTIMPGLELTLPSGWSLQENNDRQTNLTPPGQPDDLLVLMIDIVAVKSTGHGHGSTVLTRVGHTPPALVAWLTHNDDFTASTPTTVTTPHGPKMTTLVVGVSHRAHYGDGCPADRCADLFTNRETGGGTTDWYGIGGDEVVRLYIGKVRVGGTHTFCVVLDAPNITALRTLEGAANPVIDSLRLP